MMNSGLYTSAVPTGNIIPRNQVPPHFKVIRARWARLADVRFMLIVANKLNLELVQFDIKTAFLNGTLEKPVFMEVPEGLTEFLE